jgi:hypothetical protein
MFAKSTDVFEALPFEGLNGSVFVYYRQAVLPTPQLPRHQRRLVVRSRHDHAVPGKHAIIDHDIDVDRAIIDRHGPERRNYEEQMGITAFGQLWATTFVSGDQSTNARVFNGLQSARQQVQPRPCTTRPPPAAPRCRWRSSISHQPGKQADPHRRAVPVAPALDSGGAQHLAVRLRDAELGSASAASR